MRLLAILLFLVPFAAAADGLIDREVTVSVETTFAGQEPGRERPTTAYVKAEGAEFWFGGASSVDGLFIVPVFIDVGDRWLRMDYIGSGAGDFVDAQFNGYVFDFDPGCAELKGATVDLNQTTMQLSDEDLEVSRHSLRVDVAGLDYKDGDTIFIKLKIGDCVAA
ncbi:MAG: hypothetical protein AAF393_04620 [Pseudomonadota bacterium]